MFIRLETDECPARAGFATRASRKCSPYRKIAVPPLARKWLPKNLTVTDAVSKTSMPSDTYAQKAFGCAPPTSPEKPHLSTEIRHTTTVCGPRKISPVPKIGTAKTRFLPVLAGFSANSAVHRSRKASPLTIFRANSIPEKAHLWPESQPVIHAPKKLTSAGSGQENPDFPPEKPHL